VTEQLEVLVEPTWVKVQLVELKLPDPELEKLTEPAGEDFVPPPASPSETVAVQVEAWLIATEVGVQEIDIAVARKVTVRPKPVVSELFACVLPLAV
jgi:hypothetical protein